MRVDVLTLFPAMFDGPMGTSMLWKARERGLLALHVHDLRDWADNKHRKVDDTPYGGGGGMILQAPVVARAVEALLGDDAAGARVVLTTPQGVPFSHALAVELAAAPRVVFVCGHYEGIDDRASVVITDEISIGDYVLTGGELPAMVMIDALTRFIPGVLGAEGAAHRDSHADGLLEGPQYTRPLTFRGLTVPDVLQNGDHSAIARWHRQQALRRTWERRPDLLRTAPLSDEDRYYLGTLALETARRARG